MKSPNIAHIFGGHKSQPLQGGGAAGSEPLCFLKRSDEEIDLSAGV
jgi:hypothetical protein